MKERFNETINFIIISSALVFIIGVIMVLFPAISIETFGIIISTYIIIHGIVLIYLDIKAENIQNVQTLYSNFKNAYESVDPRNNTIYIEFIKEKSLLDWLASSIADFKLEKETFISNCNNAISDIEKFINLNHKQKSLENSKNILEDSDSTIREKYNSDIKEYKEKILELKDKESILKEKSNLFMLLYFINYI